MTNDELIKALRERANECGIMRDVSNRNLLNEAADRIEALDERVAIMQESMDSDWGNNYG